MRQADLIAGVVGLHRLGYGAGVFAALLAIPLVWFLHWSTGFPLVLLATVAIGVAVWWAAPRANVPVVADRLMGQMIALWPLSGGLTAAGVDPAVFPWPGWVGGFLICQSILAFVGPVKRLSRHGAIWDDVASGGAAAAIVLMAAAISHGWLM